MRLHMPGMNRKTPGFCYGTNLREYTQIAFEWVGISMFAAWLMYDALAWCWVFFPGIVLWFRFRQKRFEEKQRSVYAGQFAEGMDALATAIRVGYSVEKAVSEALKSLRMIYSRENAMMEEFQRMIIQMEMNRSLEELFFEMSERSGLEDAASLAEVFQAVRRNGGNLAEILEKTVGLLEEKEAVKQEIEVLLAGKRYEQRIMCLIPFGMILYLRIGSPGYLDPLYHSPAGICVMTLCLSLYGMAVYMGSRVLKIEV